MSTNKADWSSMSVSASTLHANWQPVRTLKSDHQPILTQLGDSFLNLPSNPVRTFTNLERARLARTISGISLHLRGAFQKNYPRCKQASSFRWLHLKPHQKSAKHSQNSHNRTRQYPNPNPTRYKLAYNRTTHCI